MSNREAKSSCRLDGETRCIEPARVEFPPTLGQLTFARELPDMKPRTGVYVCTCGTEVRKTLGNARSTHMRSSFSACGKCRRVNNRKGRGVRFSV